MRNLYTLHAYPEQLDNYDRQHDIVPDLIISRGQRTGIWDESIAVKYPNTAYYNAVFNLKGPFKLGEPAIAKNSYYSYMYANVILRGPFKLGEPVISKNGQWSLGYAVDVLKNRFKLGELAIAENAWFAFSYARFILKGRFKLGEPAIAQDAEIAVDYAILFNFRFEEAEQEIIKHKTLCRKYEKHFKIKL